jgi:hypothetical protein
VFSLVDYGALSGGKAGSVFFYRSMSELFAAFLVLLAFALLGRDKGYGK